MSESIADRIPYLSDALQDFDPHKPESFWALAPALQTFVAQGGVQAAVNRQLSALAADPHYLGDWAQNEIKIHTDAGCSLSLALFDAPRRYIHLLPYLAMYVPISGPVAYDVYQAPQGYRNDLFDPSLRLEPSGSFRAKPGEVIRLDSQRLAYDFKLAKPLTVLRLVTVSVRPLEWLFSKTSLQAWQANDAELSSTQLRVAANVLGKIAHQSSMESLRDLSRHEHHAVRWAAIQNLGRLNRSEALIKIREAVSDPHPHVRRAAQKTLDRLQAKVAP